MIKFLFSLVFYLVLSTFAIAQREGNVWVFGSSAGFDFNSGGPTAIKTSIAAGFLYGEGSASICDKSGNLLFYTEGTTVWDRNHNIMPSGAGLLAIAGAPPTWSISQATVIVPVIGSLTRYYVFSLGGTGFNNKLFYSIVDMSLNGGLGDVEAGNSGITLSSDLAEKMTVVRGDRCNAWLMVRSANTNQYKAFEITKTGINNNPVLSVCGTFPVASYSAGVIKFSPDRKKMIAACYGSPGAVGGFELYDFDPMSGMLSNTTVMDQAKDMKYYGASFSSDGTKVYGTMSSPGVVTLGVYQFDITGLPAAIVASKYQLYAKPSIGDMKRGPDGKIYIAAVGSKLSVINAPNLSGVACQFVYEGISLFTGTSDVWGLPNDVIFPIDGKDDTVFYCGGGPGKILTASGVGPYIWKVISGPAVISGSGTTVSVTSSATARIILIDSGTCRIDTTTIIVPTAAVDAGLAHQVLGCSAFVDTLTGILTDTIPWLTYNVNWQPGNFVMDGVNTLHPVINPTSNTIYKLVVTTPVAQGGCTWEDTISVMPIDKSIHAQFTYKIAYGCNEDTITFTNTTPGGNVIKYQWDFGDGANDTATNIVHVFKRQGQYLVKLYAANDMCNDVYDQPVNLEHPLKADFTIVSDTICQYDTVLFTNTSIGTTLAYQWSFGDEIYDTAINPSHIFNVPGMYRVTLTVSDFIHCHDTVYYFIQVDSTSVTRFMVSDTVCPGKGVIFDGQYSSEGYRGNIWNFGDQTTAENINPVQHLYEADGTYYPVFTTKYRACPDGIFRDTISVYPYPVVNIGVDTVLCPGQNAIILNDIVPHSTDYKTYWNTGATTSNIAVSLPGIYWLTVTNKYGCTTSDTVVVRNGCYLAIPNIFTPNGDGINDYFFPRQLLSMNVITFHMQLYNRWGTVIFETDKADGRGWDGSWNGVRQPQDVYVYLIEVTFGNGARENYKGNVILLR